MHPASGSQGRATTRSLSQVPAAPTGGAAPALSPSLASWPSCRPSGGGSSVSWCLGAGVLVWAPPAEAPDLLPVSAANGSDPGAPALQVATSRTLKAEASAQPGKLQNPGHRAHPPVRRTWTSALTPHPPQRELPPSAVAAWSREAAGWATTRWSPAADVGKEHAVLEARVCAICSALQVRGQSRMTSEDPIVGS